jgi:sarcosine oxidase
MTYDLVVVGLGGMGSATLARASLRGGRVLGIEQFARGHDLGSSGGRSRIIRQAYFEDPNYVPLLVRAYELWGDLERRTGATVWDLVGVLMVGGDDSPALAGTLRAAREFDLPLDELDAAEIVRRYPGTTPRAHEHGLFERNAGAVFPEAAIAAHLQLAESNGAEMRFETTVAGIEPRADGIRVTLLDGTSVMASRLALCAGPWLGDVARDLGLPLRVQRNVQIWFKPTTAAFGADRFPGFFVDRPEFPAVLYGFPDFGEGVKAALHSYGETTDASSLDRAIRPDDIRLVKDALATWIPAAAGEFVSGKACMYTLTPDEHFIIDHHPGDERIVIAGGFSGHGFKFCSVVGEIVDQLAFDGGSTHPIDFLRIGRFHTAERGASARTIVS